MKLPNNIRSGSRNFRVVYQDNFRKDHAINGQSNIDHQLIFIDSGIDTPRENKEITLTHEWLHMALMQVGESELSDNEDFVFKMGEKIHEFIKQVEN